MVLLGGKLGLVGIYKHSKFIFQIGDSKSFDPSLRSCSLKIRCLYRIQIWILETAWHKRTLRGDAKADSAWLVTQKSNIQNEAVPMMFPLFCVPTLPNERGWLSSGLWVQIRPLPRAFVSACVGSSGKL
jgi:hypothetical protein